MNMEHLLGKLLQETMGSSGGPFSAAHNLSQGNTKKKQKKNQTITDSLLNNVTSQLSTGKGLMTAIGLGVGAYEIFRTRGQRQTAPPPSAAPNPHWSAAPSQPSASPPPPPPPTAASFSPAQNAPAAPMPTSAVPSVPAPAGQFDDQELARRLIRIMVAAAHADGTLDADEEKAILDRLRAAALSQEEKIFLLEELHHPRPLAELTQGISDARLAQAMYAVALSAIEVDTAAERQWLDELGRGLGLSAEICRFIEETC